MGARAAAAEECAIENIDQLLETATEAHRAAHLAEARSLYARVLAAEPAHTLALFRSGLLELQDDRPLAALALIEKAVAAAPDEGRYRLGLAQTLQTLARFDDAAAVYRRVLELDPQCVEAHFGLGCALHRRGALDAAAAAYRDALTLRADDAQSLGHLGAVLRELGEIGAAIEALEAALALEPRTAAHAVNLGIALCERRDFAAAERVLHALCEREPQNAEAAFNLGNALRGLGRRRDALEHWQRAVALRADYPEALNNLGNLYKELGDFSAAHRAFDAALRARPGLCRRPQQCRLLDANLGTARGGRGSLAPRPCDRPAARRASR